MRTVFEEYQRRIEMLADAEQRCWVRGKVSMAVIWAAKRQALISKLQDVRITVAGQEYRPGMALA